MEQTEKYWSKWSRSEKARYYIHAYWKIFINHVTDKTITLTTVFYFICLSLIVYFTNDEPLIAPLCLLLSYLSACLSPQSLRELVYDAFSKNNFRQLFINFLIGGVFVFIMMYIIYFLAKWIF